MRLFLAILLDPASRSEIVQVQQQLRSHAISGNFTRQDHLHLTLAFLGETPPAALPAVRQCMAEATGDAFPLVFDRLGRFRRREGDLFFWGFSLSQPLLGLYARLQEALRRQRLPFDEKPFRPHLTLGRGVRLEDGFSYESIQTPPLSFQASSFALMESKRIGGRLTYTPLYHQALRECPL